MAIENKENCQAQTFAQNEVGVQFPLPFNTEYTDTSAVIYMNAMKAEVICHLEASARET